MLWTTLWALMLVYSVSIAVVCLVGAACLCSSQCRKRLLGESAPVRGASESLPAEIPPAMAPAGLAAHG